MQHGQNNENCAKIATDKIITYWLIAGARKNIKMPIMKQHSSRLSTPGTYHIMKNLLSWAKIINYAGEVIILSPASAYFLDLQRS